MLSFRSSYFSSLFNIDLVIFCLPLTKSRSYDFWCSSYAEIDEAIFFLQLMRCRSGDFLSEVAEKAAQKNCAEDGKQQHANADALDASSEVFQSERTSN